MSAHESDPRPARPSPPEPVARGGEIDLFDLEQRSGSAGLEQALDQATAAASVLGEEIDLDEDLFDFGPLPGFDLDPLAGAAAEIDDLLAGLPLEPLPAVLELEAVRSPPSEMLDARHEPATTPTTGAAHVPESPPPSQAHGPTPRAASLPFTSPRPRVLWLAAGFLILANVLGALLAWRSSSGVQRDLELVRGDLAATARDLRLALQSAEARAASSPAPSTRAEGEPASDPPRVVGAPALPGPGGLALAVAREELDAGLHAAARRRLAGLLATIDAQPAEQRARLEAEASFLIAECWSREADARREARP